MDPRYPVGNYVPPREVTPELRTAAIEEIAGAPAKIRVALAGLEHLPLATPYPGGGGGAVAQGVHPVSENPINAYIPFRFALPETEPTIKPYAEADWAKLDD